MFSTYLLFFRYGKIKLMLGFRFGSKNFLGVDIGTSSIKIIELSKQGKEIKLENYAEVKTSLARKKVIKPFKKNNLLLSDQNIAKAIQSIFKEAGIQTKEVNFSIPDFSTFFTTFEIPAMSKEEIPETVKYEVRPYIPLPLSEITLDWSVVKGEPGKTPLKILVVAIPNEIVSQYRTIASLAGLKLKALEPEAFALVRAVSDKDEKKVSALIDIGARSTTCTILDQGILKISHSFNVASNQLSEQLANSLNIDYNKAEELKRRYGLGIVSEDTKEEYKDIRNILIPMVDALIEEVKKIFRDFYQNEGKEIEKIILAGGLAFMPNLKEYFFAELKKEVIVANPFVKISHSSVLEKTLKQEGPSYAVAVGLALKGLE
ncbi:MAG: type IV pilus assembly protein PilM [Candidatus Nealsonbacteria bacterium]